MKNGLIYFGQAFQDLMLPKIFVIGDCIVHFTLLAQSTRPR